MDENLKRIGDEVAAATKDLGRQTRISDKKLKAIKPTLIASGTPLPQEIVFSGSKNGAGNG